MNDDPEVRRLLAPMIDRAVFLDGDCYHVDRTRTLARIAAGSRPPRAGWLGFFSLSLAAAGAAALLLWAQPWRDGTPTAAAASLELQLVEGHATLVSGQTRQNVTGTRTVQVTAEGEIETSPASSARVRAADGLQVELGGRTRVAIGGLQAPRAAVQLRRGVIRCVVPHRVESQAFEVVTPDLTVVDLGTIFTVTLDEAARGTKVSVEEGEVLIRHAGGETRLRAPGTWPSVVPAAVAVTRAPPVSSARNAPSPQAMKVLRSDATTLDDEARLLRQGLSAERYGRLSEAESYLTRLLQRHPRSPLAPDARAALLRVEAGTRR